MIKFSSIIQGNNNLLLVDGLNMAFSFRGSIDYHKRYLDMINSLKRSYKADKVVIAVDKGSSSFRKAIYPEYKANRQEKRDNQTESERLEFEAFFKSFEYSLEYVKDNSDYPIIRIQGVEADDIIAYICSMSAQLGKNHIWVVSSDRDLNLLLSESVSQFSYVTRKEFTIDNWSEHYDWSLEEYISIKCLQGDTGDNVPGVPKIGPKTALKLLEQYGSALEIAASLPLPGKYVYIKNLNEFGAENIMRNYQLMDLVTFCRDAIGEDNIKVINTELERYLNE